MLNNSVAFSKKRYVTVKIKTKGRESVINNVKERSVTKLLPSRPRRGKRRKNKARSLVEECSPFLRSSRTMRHLVITP